MISKNKVVSLNYRLKRDNKEGELIEETFGAEPMVFLYGTGSMIPKFEAELDGKKVGDSASFGIAAAEAYGERDEKALVNLPIDIFKVDGAIDMEMIKVGNVLPMQDNEGNRMDGTVTDVTETEVKMDFNHPLAGQDLHFEVEVVDVRDATQEELDHGHVHGAGGHHH
jgi:FKBP-type peptidyl-prolyl cis-trans isomerase SlyD